MLTDEWREFLEFLEDVLPGAYGFEGALNYQNLREACRLWDITGMDERITIRLLIDFLLELREAKKKRDE